MTRPVVAILAKVNNPGSQQIVMSTPVRSMAVAAIFFNRRMFPEKRSALVGMAAIAEFVFSVGTQLSMA